MNIKSLLLGSAAALVAVSGARAADAVVVAEPEPMEYVRICDVYGSGFYYIPGTETCLKIGGYVRAEMGFGDFFAFNSNTDEDTYFTRSRLQLRLDARSETELGTLRGFAALNFNYESSNNSIVSGTGAVNNAGFVVDPISIATGFDNDDTVGFDHIYIELGGFRVGKTDSLFTTFTDYSSGVMTDGIIGYGPFATQQIAYTWTGPNGFSIAAAVESGDEGESAIIDDYTPHVVGGVSWTQGWGKIGAVVGYDANNEDVAGKVRLDLNVTSQLSLFVMGGWDQDANGGFQSDADGNLVFRRDAYATWNGDYAIWAGGAYKATEKATINAEFGYDESESYSAAVNVAYEMVPGFTVTPEVVYFNSGLTDDDAWGGRLRFQRNF